MSFGSSLVYGCSLPNCSSLNLSARSLSPLECTVIWPACNRGETPRAIRTNSIDSALLDVQLDEASTYPAIEKLVRRVPFMLVTGQGNLGRSQALLANVPILAKPLRLRQLENMMSSTVHLQDRGAQHQP